MSKRTLRRAAERQAHKTEKQQQLAANAAAAITQTSSREPIEFTIEDQTVTSDLSAAAEPLRAAAAQSAAFVESQPVARREHADFVRAPLTEREAAVSRKPRFHELVSRVCVLPFENRENFSDLARSVYEEHNPETDTEQRLVDAIIQHYWLMQRAIHLQEIVMIQTEQAIDVDPKRLSLFVRYQATHERSYYKAMRELQNLKKQKHQNEIGFESQKRRQESHEAQVRLANARARNLEIDTDCRQTMEVPIPGATHLGFEELTKACASAISTLVYQNQFKTTA
jgi:hypothetical protein